MHDLNPGYPGFAKAGYPGFVKHGYPGFKSWIWETYASGCFLNVGLSIVNPFSPREADSISNTGVIEFKKTLRSEMVNSSPGLLTFVFKKFWTPDS